jgi:hypothetical protein
MRLEKKLKLQIDVVVISQGMQIFSVCTVLLLTNEKVIQK